MLLILESISNNNAMSQFLQYTTQNKNGIVLFVALIETLFNSNSRATRKDNREQQSHDNKATSGYYEVSRNVTFSKHKRRYSFQHRQTCNWNETRRSDETVGQRSLIAAIKVHSARTYSS